MTMKDELKDMFDALESGAEPSGDQTDAPTTDAPSGDETESPTTDEPFETDEPETDAPETKAPKTEPPATEPPEDDELSRTRAENEELKRKLDELQKAPKTESPTTKAPVTDPPIEDEDFTKDMDLSDSDVDPKELNKVLNLIYKKAIQRARDENKRASENLLREVPKRISQDMSTQERLQKVTENFYKQNEDLRKFPKVVSAIFDEMITKHGDKKVEDILNIVGEETRNRLGLKKPNKRVDKQNKDKDNPPPLHRRRGKRSQSQDKETTGVSKEIDAMNESLNR